MLLATSASRSSDPERPTLPARRNIGLAARFWRGPSKDKGVSMSLPIAPEAATRRGVAIVTGGRRGIGSAAAIALAQEGFSIAIVDIEQDAAAEATLAAIRSHG